MDDRELGRGWSVASAVVAAAAIGALCGLLGLAGCGGREAAAAAVMRSNYPEGQIVNGDGGSSFALSFSGLTHDGHVASGDCLISNLACKVSGPAADGHATLYLVVKGFRPVVISAEYGEDRIVGTGNGSGFYAATVALAAGDAGWVHWEAGMRPADAGPADGDELPDLLPELLR